MEGENDDQLQPLTVRVFGPNTDAVIDRGRELQVFVNLSIDNLIVLLRVILFNCLF